VTWLLAAQAAATLVMVGVIWMCQVAHYPLLGDVGSALPQYQERNVRLTTRVVGLPMLVELATVIALLVWRPVEIPLWSALLGAALLVVIWAATVLFSVPMHGRLGHGYDPAAHRRLVTTNWIRTLAWSARGVLVLWMLAVG
jgi:hypothetical protein